jgi:hypothetical protein
MHWIGPTLLVLSLILLPLALRGRLTARGLFCRRCKFDLQGLDPARTHPTCPECGRDLTQPKSTRPTLRRAHRPALAAALILLLAGITLTTITATNNTARILAAMPDAVIFGLHRLGFDPAFAEITDNRLVRIPSLEERTWTRLIDEAMAHHADVNTPWNPRHGEVLAVAMSTGRLSPEQIRAFLEPAFTSSAAITPKLRHGVSSLGVSVQVRNGPRSSVINSTGLINDGISDVFMQLKAVRAHLPAVDLTIPLDSGGGYSGMSFPGANFGGGSGSSRSVIDLSDVDWTRVEPNTEMAIELTYEIAAVRMRDNHEHFRQTHTASLTTRVIPADAEIVARVTDPDTITAFRDGPRIRVGPLYLPQDGDPGRLGRMAVILDHCPVAISGQVVVIHDGVETEVSTITSHAMPGGYGITGVSWNADTDADRAVRDTLAEAQTVTIEIRPDPRHAERTPGIDAILGVPLRFENVKITRTDPGNTVTTSAPHSDHVPGRPVITEPQTPPAADTGAKTEDSP